VDTIINSEREDFVERRSQFSKFEKALEKEAPSAYHEEWNQEQIMSIGVSLIALGLLPGFLTRFSKTDVLITGLIFSTIGTVIILLFPILKRTKWRTYSFRGLSRKTISESIMFLDFKLAQPEELESTVPYHENEPLTRYQLSKMKLELPKFFKSTAGLIIWPYELISEFKMELEHDRHGLPVFIICIATILLMPLAAMYFMYTSGSDVLLVFAFISLFIFLQVWFNIPQFLASNEYLFNKEWLSSLRTSQTCQLDESLNEIFSLLRLEFPYPLRFHVVRDYPLLNYTSRTKTSYTLVRLKEAVLYPASTENEMPL
jgi:hypothetical protein